MAMSGRTPGRPPARDLAAVFALGVAGTLIPIAGWVIGVWFVVRASSWSPSEKLLGLVGPIVGLLVIVAVVAGAANVNLGVSVALAVPLTLSVASAVGAVYLAARLVAHKRAAEATAR
jgi:heme A synthase